MRRPGADSRTSTARGANVRQRMGRLRHVVNPFLAAEGSAGTRRSATGGESVRLSPDALRPAGDSLKLSLFAGARLPSDLPRTASLEISRDTTQLDVEWDAGSRYTVVGLARYDSLDGRQRAHRSRARPEGRSVLRSERFNIDLGLRALFVRVPGGISPTGITTRSCTSSTADFSATGRCRPRAAWA